MLLLSVLLPITNDVSFVYNASVIDSKAVVCGFTPAAVISAHVATAAVPCVVTDVGAFRAIVVAVAMVLPVLV